MNWQTSRRNVLSSYPKIRARKKLELYSITTSIYDSEHSNTFASFDWLEVLGVVLYHWTVSTVVTKTTVERRGYLSQDTLHRGLRVSVKDKLSSIILLGGFP